MIQIENLYVNKEEAVSSLRGWDQYQRSSCKTCVKEAFEFEKIGL